MTVIKFFHQQLFLFSALCTNYLSVKPLGCLVGKSSKKKQRNFEVILKLAPIRRTIEFVSRTLSMLFERECGVLHMTNHVSLRWSVFLQSRRRCSSTIRSFCEYGVFYLHVRFSQLILYENARVIRPTSLANVLP